MEKNDELRETERFVRIMNKFFDCLNVRCTTEYIKERNPDRKPYHDESDERLRVSLIYCFNFRILDYFWFVVVTR